MAALRSLTAAIAGRVYDRYGDPVGNANVQALKYVWQDGKRLLTAVQTVRTNDLGEYRLFWMQPGQYVVSGRPLVRVWPGDRVSKELATQVISAFALGTQRTSAQDAEFAVQQLVEIAVRALSPGINDPYTAIACVDRLGSALCRLAQREMPSP